MAVLLGESVESIFEAFCWLLPFSHIAIGFREFIVYRCYQHLFRLEIDGCFSKTNSGQP